jgi:microcystin-dependent protein
MCYGTSVAIEGTYNELYKVIGRSFGATGPTADAPTHFNLPDLRGSFLRGVDGSRFLDPDKKSRFSAYPGGNIGNNVGSFQWDAYEHHTHEYAENIYYGGGGGTSYGGWTRTTVGNPDPPKIRSQGKSTETRPRNVNVNYIIRFA